LWWLSRLPWLRRLPWMPLRRLRWLRRLLCIHRLLPPLLSGASWLHVSGDDLIWPGSIIDPANSYVCAPGQFARGKQFPAISKNANALIGVPAPDDAAMRPPRNTGIRVLIR
jgi:hypothetical protein